MMVCSPISTCLKNVVYLRGQMTSSLCSVISRGPSNSRFYRFYTRPNTKYINLSISNTPVSPCIGYQSFQAGWFSSSSRGRKFQSLKVTESNSDKGTQKLEVSLAGKSMKLRLFFPKQRTFQKLKCIGGSWPQEAAETNEDNSESCHGKKVYTDFSVIGIPGDGRCMFRSVAHGACLRSGKSAPSDHVQRELADDLRAKVADEFIKRRQETEWFVEGDFDTYVSEMRKPHVWGGEPELFMASHVLKMPITVYMYDKEADGLIAIAEYGQEYGTENPIRVLYHGFGHYDALQMPGSKKGKSKL